MSSKGRATAVTDAIVVASISMHGVIILETMCADSEAYRALPALVTYEGVLYRKSAWSSDRDRAFYKQVLGREVAYVRA